MTTLVILKASLSNFKALPVSCRMQLPKASPLFMLWDSSTSKNHFFVSSAQDLLGFRSVSYSCSGHQTRDTLAPAPVCPPACQGKLAVSVASELGTWPWLEARSCPILLSAFQIFLEASRQLRKYSRNILC